VIRRTPPGDCPPLAGDQVGFDQVVADKAILPLQEGGHVAAPEAMFADYDIGLAVHSDEFVKGKGGSYPVMTIVSRRDVRCLP
jgi:hypothetical protein